MAALRSAQRPDHSLFTLQGRFRTGALLALMVITAIVAGWASHLIVWARSGDAPKASLFAYGLLFGSYVFMATLVVFLVLRRLGRTRTVFRALLPAYAVGTLVFVLFRWAGDQWLLPAWGVEPNYPPGTGIASFALDNLTYAALPFFFGALLHLAESQFIGLRQRLELAHEQRITELDMLRARVAPHFLYNTLNNLYALSMRPGADVSSPLHTMAELMRHITKRDGQALPLADEWALVQRYTALQALRYDKPLHLTLDADERALIQPMAALVLLPLLENAFKHGDPCSTEVPLALTVRTSDDRLLVNCSNRMAKDPVDDGPSTGLRDLQRLLLLLYDGSAQTNFRTVNDRFVAELSMPIHRHA